MRDYQDLDIHCGFVLYSATSQLNTSLFNMLECHTINETSETLYEPFSLVLSKRLNSVTPEQDNSCTCRQPPSATGANCFVLLIGQLHLSLAADNLKFKSNDLVAGRDFVNWLSLGKGLLKDQTVSEQ